MSDNSKMKVYDDINEAKKDAETLYPYENTTIQQTLDGKYIIISVRK